MKNKKHAKDNLLSKRVFFVSEAIRVDFFARLKSKFNSWADLINHFGLYKSKFERFRYGINSIPYNIFLEFFSLFNKEEKEYFNKNIFLKDKNWGSKKGGKSTYSKHKEIFEKGRKIGSKVTKYHFDIRIPLTKDIGELIGAFIGDGFTNKYGRIYVTQFTGDAKLDKDYIISILQPIIKNISKNSNPIISQFENTMRMTVYSKEFYDLLTKRFSLTAGKKAYTVTIPGEILESKDQKIVDYCIRGIFDTDGSIFLDRRKAYNKPYVRIGLEMKSKELIKQVKKLLTERGINARETKNWDRIQINGIKECKKFVDRIGFSNKRHLDKIKSILNVD